jgi:serine/threonine-protein kinase
MTDRPASRGVRTGNGRIPKSGKMGGPMMSLPRVLADRYQIVRRVGTGGMADVYLARDTLLGRQVALKILHPQFASDESFVERFRREARAAANLQHPNAVSIYDWGQQDGHHFMVMEYVEGRSLKDVIAAEAPLEARRASAVAFQVLLALEYAHRSGLVHRDIKPGNILLTSSGDARVTDFGIVRASDGDTMTQTGTILGTAYYLSPEQAQGLPVDARSDVYSLGVVLYEMVTGARPFEGPSPVAIAYKHVRSEPPRPSSVRPDIPVAAESIILRSLAKRPDDRYQSAAAMREDIQAFLEGRQVTAVLPSPTQSLDDTQVIRVPGQARRGAARRPGWLLALALALLAGGLTLGTISIVNLLSPAIGRAEVPSLTGKTPGDAELLLRQRGLDPSYQGNEASDTVVEGRVTRQRPDPRLRVAKGSAVRYWVSSGLAVVSVPDLRGISFAEARRRLDALDLTVGVRTDVFDQSPPETVLGQNPRANSPVRKATPIDLTVSKGPETGSVPEVIGNNEADAATILANQGFRVERYEGFSDSYPPGYVFDQDPKGGTPAVKGSAVKIYIVTGARTFEMPNVIGQTEAAASAQLQQAGLVVQVEHVFAAQAQRGRVVNQDPTPGRPVKRGDNVTIFVGQ